MSKNNEAIIYNSSNNNINDVIHNLRDYRESRGITQKQIGEAMGINDNLVSRLESCKHSPTIKMINRYIQAMGVCYEIRIVKSKDKS